MASRLRAVVPKAAVPSKPKILIYGKPGVGKTWGALDFPGVYYIDPEGGADLEHYTDKLAAADGMYMGPDLGANDFPTVIDQVKALATERHDFKTLVIDSASVLFHTAIAEESESLGDKDQFGASKKAGVRHMRILIRWLKKLNMNVLLVAHSIPEWGLVNGRREQIGDAPDVWEKVEYELHLCLQIEKQGKSRFARVRKTRLKEFEDADRFPWSYENFAQRYGKTIIEANSTAIELASPEQVAELTGLLSVVKVPDGWGEKYLSDNDAETWADVPAANVAAVIARLHANVSKIKETA
jgi:hypothetical protein